MNVAYEPGAERMNVAYERQVQEESLILDATELVYALLEDRHISKAELARRLDRTKGYVTQILSGSRNMTLRTLADIAHAIGVELEIRVKTKSVPLPYPLAADLPPQDWSQIDDAEQAEKERREEQSE